MLDWYDVDYNLRNDLIKERKDMNIMYDILTKNNKIEKWLYGHFHCSNIIKYENLDFITLNIFEIKTIY